MRPSSLTSVAYSKIWPPMKNAPMRKVRMNQHPQPYDVALLRREHAQLAGDEDSTRMVVLTVANGMLSSSGSVGPAARG